MRKRLVKKQMEHIAVIKLKNEQETIKQKIDFFTNVTHEIRTPLTLISSPLEYLLQGKLLDDDVRDCLQIMKLNVGRLLQLSNQLLDFHSVEKDGFKLNFTVTNLSQIIKDTNNRFVSMISQRSLKCSLILDEQIWANVDYEAFVKIVSNLLGNALKHAYSYINIELRKVNDSAILTVENDGRLIGMSLREKIFEPFFQIKDDNNWGFGNGSGLGLPLARKLAMLHDGTLHYKVSESGGNCFVLTLPLCVVASVASHLDNEMPESDEDKALVVGRSTILLVEDDEELLNLISKWMCADYNVVKAVNGLVALQQLETKDVDLIISDVMMPELDGIGLLKELKSNYKYSHIPVVFLTAKNNLDIKVLSLDLGVDAYIEKPFSYSILKAQIINLIEKKKDVKRLFSIYPIESVNKLTENEADRKFLEEVNKAIDKHLDNSELNIDLLSKELALSRSTINRKFKGLSEVTPGEYIKLFRLKKASALLRSGNYRINEIVYLTGFSTSSYFAKCFKEQFGLLPNEYMKIYKGGDHPMSVSMLEDE
ncbi:MAG: response regulator [Muribaculaceae bacterium]|nr:response regulator [Muribaculaceae bacterium]